MESTMIKTSRAERHIRALELAKKCAAFGARVRTIGHVTGLPHGELACLFFADIHAAPRGRAPDSPDWYHGANVLSRVEASIFLSVFRRIRELGFGPAEALVSGYQHYRTVCRDQMRISFDRAFDLASHLDGLWLARIPNFSLLDCPACASQYVTALGTNPVSNHECTFCKLVTRYPRDPRIQSSFQSPGLTDMNNVQLGVIALSRRWGSAN